VGLPQPALAERREHLHARSQARRRRRSGRGRGRRILVGAGRRARHRAARQRQLPRRVHRGSARDVDRRLMELHRTARGESGLHGGAGAAALQAAGRVVDAASVRVSEAEVRRPGAPRGGVDTHPLDDRSRGRVDAEGGPGLREPQGAQRSAGHRRSRAQDAAGPGAQLAGRPADAEVGRGGKHHAAGDRQHLHRKPAKVAMEELARQINALPD